LRHEAISALFEMGLQTQHVMLISGHSNLAQLSRYTNTSPEEVFEYLRKINT
jgi:site-specific recombinase XerD